MKPFIQKDTDNLFHTAAIKGHNTSCEAFQWASKRNKNMMRYDCLNSYSAMHGQVFVFRFIDKKDYSMFLLRWSSVIMYSKEATKTPLLIACTA